MTRARILVVLLACVALLAGLISLVYNVHAVPPPPEGVDARPIISASSDGLSYYSGGPFGQDGDLVFWIGPDHITPFEASPFNGNSAETVDGVRYMRGEIIAR